ncbi:hypothetical protein VNO77_44764 [Canavalia gladiata]|uniref:Uncharacterized protein n=1 Tax=Canavalia gladiata TaxID=3824 RepID=A0AAN9JWH1_CANGL
MEKSGQVVVMMESVEIFTVVKISCETSSLGDHDVFCKETISQEKLKLENDNENLLSRRSSNPNVLPMDEESAFISIKGILWLTNGSTPWIMDYDHA